MANDRFDSGDYTPPTANTTARAASIASLAQAVEAGFDLLPDVVVLNQDRVTYAADTGAADAYLMALPETLPSYTAGLRVMMKAANANTGASTLNIDSRGVKTIKRGNGDALVAGDITAGSLVVLGYDGTDFRVLTGPGSSTEIANAVAAHAALTTTHGVSGTLVGTSDSQTLSNKSLTSPTLTGTVTLPGTTAAITSDGIGLGAAPTSTSSINVLKSQDAKTATSVGNAHAGTGAFAQASVHNGTDGLDLRHNGTGFTTAGVVRQSGSLIQGTGAGGLTLNTSVNQPIYFAVNSTAVANFNTTPALDLTCGQIKFPGTQAASADANTLDDYEEFTFTPTLGDGTNNYTLSFAEGYGTKIGNRVFWEAIIIWTSIGSAGSTRLKVTALPFTSANVGIITFGITVGQFSGLDATATLNQIMASQGANSSEVHFWRANDNAARSELPADSSSATGLLVVSGHYRV